MAGGRRSRSIIAAFAPDLGRSPFGRSTRRPTEPPPFTQSADGFLFLNKDAFLHAFAPDVKDNAFLEASQVPYGLPAVTRRTDRRRMESQAELVPALGRRPDHPARTCSAMAEQAGSTVGRRWAPATLISSQIRWRPQT